MLRRFAPLVPLTLAVLLGACATTPQPAALAPEPATPPTVAERAAPQPAHDLEPSSDTVSQLTDEQDYALPQLADSIIERGYRLVGTPYRYGGASAKTGFDCSGFVGFLFRKEAGIELPRSTRQMIGVDAPLVAREDLEPGDVLFFNDRGRGRVSHAGIYIGDDRFIHSASRRSGGVRVDSLDDSYWRSSFMEAKRVLALAPADH
ncbi:C40 family peptidase [Stutzerimonas azotifigens]|uniref:C40 family peptidase n=1 Tax=Stutzerimonas azotifigens TaxID=291995 RepID=UPI000484E818|nr:C40 family peptidase [Stutzerimonas azotifigens]